ncbi:MAG: hypothetical protein PVS2B1_02670 [Candidatus Dormibacteraceae bacterium]
MPESEPKPKLIELVTPGAGQGWKAVLKNGKPAVIHEIPVPPAEATAAIPRIQRLADHKHPALSPVLAWGTDTNGIWVAVEPNEGTPLATMLSRGPLTPPAAAALGAAVLSGVAALHEAGIAMGGFAASAIRVNSNGEVRLAGHPAAAVRGAPSQSDLRADVRSCGMAVCAAFGVDPAGAPAPPNVPPGLVVTMRSMASGAMGPAADRAQNALREMASALLAPDRAVAAQTELATRAGGRDTPGVTPFVPPGTVPPDSRPIAPVPVPFTPPAPRQRDETPVRAPASYDAPARSVQTYPSIPAPTYGPPPVVPIPVPPAPVEPRAPESPRPAPVPTWADPPASPAAAAPPPAPPAAPAWEAPPPVPPAPVPFAAPASPGTPPSPFDSDLPRATTPPASPPPAAPPPAFTPSPPPAFTPAPAPPPAAAPPPAGVLGPGAEFHAASGPGSGSRTAARPATLDAPGSSRVEDRWSRACGSGRVGRHERTGTGARSAHLASTASPNPICPGPAPHSPRAGPQARGGPQAVRRRRPRRPARVADSRDRGRGAALAARHDWWNRLGQPQLRPWSRQSVAER